MVVMRAAETIGEACLDASKAAPAAVFVEEDDSARLLYHGSLRMS